MFLGTARLSFVRTEAGWCKSSSVLVQVDDPHNPQCQDQSMMKKVSEVDIKDVGSEIQIERRKKSCQE
jgi:hypothetical protein